MAPSFRVFYEGVRIHQSTTANYTLFYLLRRFLTALVLVVLETTPFFQCAILLELSMINLSYILSTKPLINRSENNVELVNEGTIYLSALLLTNFLNEATPVNLASVLGWILIAIIGLNILFNFGLVAFSTVSLLLEMHKKKKKQNEKLVRNYELGEAKKQVKDAIPELYQALLRLEEYNKALEIHKEWAPQRKWLL